MQNPYTDLPKKSFWRSGVASLSPFDISALHTPKFSISRSDRFSTAGSCFAQHLSRAIVAQGIRWIDAEPAPPGLSHADQQRFNYGIFSFRTSNIYTTALLRQWLEWASGVSSPPEGDDTWWEAGGRFFDPFRPSIEPDGFASADEVIRSRERTLRAIRRTVEDATVFVFTLGLTEAWMNANTGVFYPTCPGTLAGTFDPNEHVFRNLDYTEVRANLERAISIMRSLNPKLLILLTVSPVPLTATAQPNAHVLTATTYSKSVLRAVAGDLAQRLDYVDYFPSYEIITAPPYRAMWFEPNMRSVSSHGVDHVMRHFLSNFGLAGGAPVEPPSDPQKEPGVVEAEKDDADVVCEDAVLEFYNADGNRG